MYFYSQEDGRLVHDFELPLGYGYSGHGEGKNNPALQHVPDVGPIPVGDYTIEPAINSPTHGPVAMPLSPDHANDMYGRGGFLIHGDSLEHPGEASLGCIIMPRNVRDIVSAGTDRRLRVV